MRKAAAATLAALLGAVLVASGTPGAARAEPQWPRVETTLQRAATELPGGVRRFASPRADLHVTLDGVEIRPALASWLAFSPAAAARQW